MMVEVGDSDRVHRPEHEPAQSDEHEMIAPAAKTQIVKDIVHQAEPRQEEQEGEPERGQMPAGGRGDERPDQPWRGAQQLDQALAASERNQVAPRDVRNADDGFRGSRHGASRYDGSRRG
jgi:hypothetical protein